MTTATLPTTSVNLVAFRRFLLALTVAADNYAAAQADAWDWLMDHCASWN